MNPRAPEPIDWALAERLAVRVAGRHPSPAAPLQPDSDSVAPLVGLAEDLVAATTRLRPPTPATVEVIDREQWVRVNLATFRSLVNRIEENRREREPEAKPKRASKAMAVQLGMMLGWMSGRVLGQYDALVDPSISADLADPADLSGAAVGIADAVYLVGPNVAAIEQRHDFDPTQFRLWVILHELTHRAQFLGVPWMREHYRDLVHEMVAMADLEPAQIVASIREAVRDRPTAKARMDEGGIAALLATDEQRDKLRSIAGLMSLLEGHGDVVMTRAAGDHVPDADHFASVLQKRRSSAPPLTRLLMRVLGVEAKIQQYRTGENFIVQVEEVGGERAVDRCWQSVGHLPSWDEVRSPDLWMARVGLAHA